MSKDYNSANASKNNAEIWKNNLPTQRKLDNRRDWPIIINFQDFP